MIANDAIRPVAYRRPRPAPPPPAAPPRRQPPASEGTQGGLVVSALAGVAATVLGGILRDGRLGIIGAAVAVTSILLGFPLVKQAEK
jgi:hypothetical protein